MFANTCRHRGHELLAAGRHVEQAHDHVPLPRVDLRPARVAEGGPRLRRGGHRSSPPSTGWSSCPSSTWAGWVLRARRRAGRVTTGAAVRASPRRPDHAAGAVRRRLARASADRHTYEVAANWKVIAENYHECYHCPLIHPELCEVTPPDSGAQLRPARRMDRRRHGAARRHGVHVARRLAGRDAAARCRPAHRGVPRTCCPTCWSPRTRTTS